MLTREGLSQTASLTLAAVWPYYVATLQAPEIAQADFAASESSAKEMWYNPNNDEYTIRSESPSSLLSKLSD